MLETEIKVTAEVAAQHGLTAEEYARILNILGRDPNITELGIFSVMWSEHCSYKSSKVHLKRLPTRGARVVQGPGENAGVVDIGDGLVAAFKMESHNHPSFVEPFQGAATGVGGILRDIFTMGARPIAVMDALRFGPIVSPVAPAGAEVISRNRRILDGVIGGIAHYGNCFGVPTVGGDVHFEPCYSHNPLVNALALGIARREELFFAKARGTGNPVIYVGAKTGRDGIHGASLLASAEFTEESQQKRPNVQVGDPFLEKLLLEACLEAMHTGAVVAIQDMGAAGLTCSTCEMGSRGGTGIEIELAKVPQRETEMTPYEIMLSESQERMLLVAESGREREVLGVFSKWGLDAVIIGRVTDDGLLRVLRDGKTVAEIPAHPLAEEGPVYSRPMKKPEPREDERYIVFTEEAIEAVGAQHAAPSGAKAPQKDRPSNVAAEAATHKDAGLVGRGFSPPESPAKSSGALAPEGKLDLTSNFKKLLAWPGIASKRWIFEQYDSMVRTNTLVGPGAGDAAVMRVKGTKRALALATDCNSRWCWLDPRTGTMHAVAEAARNVACCGARPIAVTNCLNFGNPEKPEVMWQFSQAIDGLAEACNALGTPVTGGNVSFYNETLGRPIHPTPMIGMLGILDDAAHALGMGFRSDGDIILLLMGFDERVTVRDPTAANTAAGSADLRADMRSAVGAARAAEAPAQSPPDAGAIIEERRREFSSSEYARVIHGVVAGIPPEIDLAAEKKLVDALVALGAEGKLHSAHDISDGGLAVALAECCFASVNPSGAKGAHAGAPLQQSLLSAEVGFSGRVPVEAALFGERGARAVVSCPRGDVARVQEIARQYGLAARRIGRVTAGGAFRVQYNERTVIEAPVDALHDAWANALERAIRG